MGPERVLALLRLDQRPLALAKAAARLGELALERFELFLLLFESLLGLGEGVGGFGLLGALV